ncbi:MAG: CvpA family protein [Bacteroidales bacterium]|nr:CvpA family protein [Bacteroidales bacterium]
MKKTITIIALWAAYAVFAFFSAYFTATSLSLNLLQGTNLWIIFIMVFIIALLAGWCLTEFIKQISNHIDPKKSITILTFIGFILFWGVSFMTNVHYFFVQKHGYTVLNKELSNCKNYLTENTDNANKRIENDRSNAINGVRADIQTTFDEFTRELNNAMESRIGFGDHCIILLQQLESRLNSDTALYHDKSRYLIYDESRDRGYYGRKERKDLQIIYSDYRQRIENALQRKTSAINAYYDLMIVKNDVWKEILRSADSLATYDLPEVREDGSVEAYFAYNSKQNALVVDKMPSEYDTTCIIYKVQNANTGEDKASISKKIAGYKIYPSKHMFDTFTVWNDIMHGYLPEYMRIWQWILISLLVDVVAFLLFYLANKQSSSSSSIIY